MKRIFRLTNVSLLLAATLALGAVSTFAQDPPAPAAPAAPTGNCADVAGYTALYAKITELFKDKMLPALKLRIAAGKEYLEKYGSCGEATAQSTKYLTDNIPVWEERYKKEFAAAEKLALEKRFNDALAAKNWDEVYAAGKELLNKYPAEAAYKDIMILLGTIGFDEQFANKNSKYNAETIRYAKMVIADIDAGKTFSTKWGVGTAAYGTKDKAYGWMNLIAGYLTAVGEKNMAGALPYLYKATQTNAETSKNPIPYEQIGFYYFAELDKLTTQIKAEAALQAETDTPEVAKQKVDSIKAKVAMSNGLAERAIDAFSRAYTLGTAADYKKAMKTNVENAYKLRFAKVDGLDAWIASTVAKPFVNPTTPVTPISDEPTTTTTTSGVGSANGTGIGAANGSGIGRANGTGIGAGNGTGVSGGKPVAITPAKPIKP